MDGRVRRGELNRQAIVDAALALVAEQGSLPTAQAVAERAGVAKRSLFHHFPDMEALLAQAADTQAATHWQVLQPPRPGHDLGPRISVAVAQRAELFEAIGPVRRVAVRYELSSSLLAERLRESRAGLRRHLRRSLNPELSQLDRCAQEAVQAVASWETWEVLRRHQGLSVPAARDSVRSILESALRPALVKES